MFIEVLLILGAIFGLLTIAGLALAITLGVLLLTDLLTGSHRGRKVCRWLLFED